MAHSATPLASAVPRTAPRGATTSARLFGRSTAARASTRGNQQQVSPCCSMHALYGILSGVWWLSLYFCAKYKEQKEVTHDASSSAWPRDGIQCVTNAPRLLAYLSSPLIAWYACAYIYMAGWAAAGERSVAAPLGDQCQTQVGTQKPPTRTETPWVMHCITP
jgi:hypothetical protein